MTIDMEAMMDGLTAESSLTKYQQGHVDNVYDTIMYTPSEDMRHTDPLYWLDTLDWDRSKMWGTFLKAK